MGPGIYGAPDPRKSWCYADGEEPMRFMFVCRFNLRNARHRGPPKYEFDEYLVGKDDRCVVLWMLKVKKVARRPASTQGMA